MEAEETRGKEGILRKVTRKEYRYCGQCEN